MINSVQLLIRNAFILLVCSESHYNESGRLGSIDNPNGYVTSQDLIHYGWAKSNWMFTNKGFRVKISTITTPLYRPTTVRCNREKAIRNEDIVLNGVHILTLTFPSHPPCSSLVSIQNFRQTYLQTILCAEQGSVINDGTKPCSIPPQNYCATGSAKHKKVLHLRQTLHSG